MAFTVHMRKSSRLELFVISVIRPGELSKCYWCVTCLLDNRYLIDGHNSPTFTILLASETR